jgi:UPF0042 nucleotide-binding protein
MATSPRRLIVVTGLSGAGKTVVLNALEDMDFFCIDNLPIGLLMEFLRQGQDPNQSLYQKMAIGIDARNPQDILWKFPELLKQMSSCEMSTELVFVEAAEDALIKRFSETRRKHPLSKDGLSLRDAIREERQLLGPLLDQADIRIDTTHSHVHQLRDLVRERVAKRAVSTLSLQLISFGYKNGVPHDADFVFDSRCLPNPYWEPSLRDHTGHDPSVIDFLEGSPLVREMVRHISGFLDAWVPRFEADNRSYLTVAVGCTGGHHRSVYLVEQLRAHFAAQGKGILVTHRDI